MPRCAAPPPSRKKLEHLCRSITRPAIANERLTLNRAGQVVLTLKTPYQDGTTPIVMSPREFMQRLAALVPRPRLHLIRFHGVLAPNAKLRPQIIPSSGRQAGNVPVPGFPGAPDANDKLADHGDAPHHSAPARISWARLGGVEGCYYAPPLPVRSGRATFTASGSRCSRLSSCSCGCSRGSFRAPLEGFQSSSYRGFHRYGVGVSFPH